MELAKIIGQGVEITYCDPAAMFVSAENARIEYDNAVASGIQEGIDILKEIRNSCGNGRS